MYTEDMDPLSVLEHRYGCEKMRSIFRANSYLKRLLEVEATLAEVQSDRGMIPQEHGKMIRDGIEKVERERVEEIESEIKHDVMAVVKALAEQVGEAGKSIHFGATSYDIVDTARALQHKEALTIVESNIEKLIDVLKTLAKKYSDVVMLGRTHGQWATPVTFGLKMIVFATEMNRHLERLQELKPRIVVGKFLGAVGTGAAMAPHTLEVQKKVMEKLKLGEPLATTQILGRDRLAELINWGANLATSLEKFTIEVRNLQRSDIGEASEAFDAEKQVGSSTMAQKKNPVTSENIAGLSRMIRSLSGPALENNLQWHERDLANSSSERLILPQFYVMLEDAIAKTSNVFENIYVNEERMRRNLEETGGLPLGEAVMIALSKKGMGRQEAHEFVRTITMEAEKNSERFDNAIKNNEEVRNLMSEEEIETVLEPSNYIGHSVEIIEKCLKEMD